MIDRCQPGSTRSAVRRLAGLATVLIMVGCTTNPPHSESASASPAPAPESAPTVSQPEDIQERVQSGYGLQPGDIISVSVWQDPALNQLVMVRPDGGISFPLAGDLKAEGHTVSELTAALVQRLSVYIPDAVVTVSLQEIPGNRIYILGRVNKPGDFVIARDVTIMQALAMAGGLTPFANESQIKVLRYQNGQQLTLPFNYKQVERGHHLAQDVLLQAGDVIVVP